MAGPDSSQSDQISDAVLMQRVAEGDRAAAAELVNRYQPMVRRFLRKIARHEDMADDLAQETFVRLLVYADRYDPTYPVKTWLLTIARRLWLNRIGRAHVRRRSDAEVDPVSTPASDPHVLVAVKEQAARQKNLIEQALTQLSEPQREAVVLFHQQELSVEETAEVMEMPANTVKSHLRRARAAMRKLLEADRESIGA